MSDPVFILGGYQTDFAKSWARQGQDISDMTREGTLCTLEAAALEASQVESIHVGNAFGELQRQQAHLGESVAQVVDRLEQPYRQAGQRWQQLSSPTTARTDA